MVFDLDKQPKSVQGVRKVRWQPQSEGAGWQMEEAGFRHAGGGDTSWMVYQHLNPWDPVTEGPYYIVDFLGYNKVEQRGGTRLLEFKETGDPLLIVDTLGDGRLACFTSDILPHWGSPRFVEWGAYLDFWEQFFRWLAGK